MKYRVRLALTVLVLASSPKPSPRVILTFQLFPVATHVVYQAKTVSGYQTLLLCVWKPVASLPTSVTIQPTAAAEAEGAALPQTDGPFQKMPSPPAALPL